MNEELNSLEKIRRVQNATIFVGTTLIALSVVQLFYLLKKR